MREIDLKVSLEENETSCIIFILQILINDDAKMLLPEDRNFCAYVHQERQ